MLTTLGAVVVISAIFGGFYVSDNVSSDNLTTVDDNNDYSVNEPILEKDDFVFAFYSKIAKENEKSNIFFSPLSISTAFLIAYEGAGDNTASEIQQVFGFESDNKKRREMISDTLSRLNHKDDWYNLQVANALWIKDGYEIKQNYIDVATTHYSSTVENVDFVTNNGIDKINNWVKEKTNDKIEKILESGSTDELTRMVITNAVYFKGKWSSQFSPEKTTDKPFWTGKNNSVIIPMMREPADVYNYLETDKIQALELNYLGGNISMVVLLPKDRDGIESLEQLMNKNKFDSIKNSMTKQPLTVEMPKFEFETEYDLISPLEHLGLHDAFDEDMADFQGITDEQIYLAQAKHKAFVNVDEEGTEAAAITALVFEFTSGPPEPVNEFIADHPFMFIIQEKETGEILFIGRLVSP